MQVRRPHHAREGMTKLKIDRNALKYQPSRLIGGKQVGQKNLEVAPYAKMMSGCYWNLDLKWHKKII